MLEDKSRQTELARLGFQRWRPLFGHHTVRYRQCPQLQAGSGVAPDPAALAPRVCRAANSRRVTQPEVWFRIRHVAEDGHHRPLGDAYRKQTVEVTLGPKGAFKKGQLAHADAAGGG
jgi:hypothetical protein